MRFELLGGVVLFQNKKKRERIMMLFESNKEICRREKQLKNREILNFPILKSFYYLKLTISISKIRTALPGIEPCPDGP